MRDKAILYREIQRVNAWEAGVAQFAVIAAIAFGIICFGSIRGGLFLCALNAANLNSIDWVTEITPTRIHMRIGRYRWLCTWWRNIPISEIVESSLIETRMFHVPCFGKPWHRPPEIYVMPRVYRKNGVPLPSVRIKTVQNEYVLSMSDPDAFIAAARRALGQLDY